jgi:hypothetical protein
MEQVYIKITKIVPELTFVQRWHICIIFYASMLFYISVSTTEQRLIHWSLSTPLPVVLFVNQ